MAKRTVLKIGGGILKDRACFDRVVSILKEKRRKGEECIVVISALYGTTDFLIESMGKCLRSNSEIAAVIKKLKETHKGYLSHLKNRKARENAEFALDDKISILERFLYGIHYLNEISPRSKDLIQSFGERLSPIVLEAFLIGN